MRRSADLYRLWGRAAECRGDGETVDGGLTSTKQIGQPFSYNGSGYTPHRTVTRYLIDPVGNRITLSPTSTADASGSIGWNFTVVCTTPLGTGTVLAVDDATSRESNRVTHTITQSPTCGGSAFRLTVFPLPNRTHLIAVINSVFDHSMGASYHGDDRVVAYTGEEGRGIYGRQYVTTVGGRQLHAVRSQSGSAFRINGHYTGGNLPTTARPTSAQLGG